MVQYHSSGCTRTSIEGVRRLCGGLPPHVSKSGNPSQRRRPICSRLPRKYGTDGVRGNRLFDSPGRLSVPFAATKGTRNCIILYGNVHFSMQRGSVSRWLPQSPSVTAPSRRELLCTPMLLVLCRNAHGDSFRQGGCHLSATSIGAAAPDGLPLVSVDSLISFPASPDSPLG